MSYVAANRSPRWFIPLMTLVVIVLVGFAQSTQAWLLEPQSSQKAISESDIKQFEQASSLVLRAATVLFGALEDAEASRRRISSDSLAVSLAALRKGADVFAGLQKSSLVKVQLNWKLLSARVPELHAERERAERFFKLNFQTGSDLAVMLETSARKIAESVEMLAKSKLGPDIPLDREGRNALQQALIRIGIYMRVANAGSVALSLVPDPQ